MRRGITILLLMFFSSISYGQTSTSDSLFMNLVFSESMYSAYWFYPGHWYVNDSVTSLPQMYSAIDNEFPFEDSDFQQAYANLQVSSTMVPDTAINATMNFYFNLYGSAYKQLDPLFTLPFSLNNKSANSYFTFTPGSVNVDMKTAFLIIPGSNENQTSEVIRGSGYHNNLCYVKNKLMDFGDVYIHTKPGEDYRAFYRNRKKLNSANYSGNAYQAFLYNYLNAQGHPYAINYMIECFSLIKYLKQNYDKVIVLGCSLGGYSTVLTVMNTPVDAAVISSGYSIKLNDSYSDLLPILKNFNSLGYSMTDSAVKNGLQNATADCLFSYADLDNYWYQQEHDHQYTQTYLSGLQNCSFFYDYTGHTFPPCSTLDSFLTRVIPRPKLTFSDSMSCHLDSTLLKVHVIGKLPYSFDITKDSVLWQSLTLTSHDTIIAIYDEGQYQFVNLKDSNLITGLNSPIYTFKKDSLQDFSFQLAQVNCNTLNSTYLLQLTMNAHSNAFLYSHVGNVNIIDTLNSPSLLKLFVNNTVTYFDSITSVNGCKLVLGDSLEPQLLPIQSILSTPVFYCDSPSMYMNVAISSSFPPYQLNYKKNGAIDSIIVMGNTTLPLPFGVYEFTSVTDSLGCLHEIGDTIISNLKPLTFDTEMPYYSCDSVKHVLPIKLSGNPPFTIYYRKNNIAQQMSTLNVGLSLWLENGIYDIDSVTDQTCTLNLTGQYYYEFNYSPMTIQLGDVDFDCVNHQSFIELQVNGGVSPYTLTYSTNNILDTLIFSNPIVNLNLLDGIISLHAIKDSLNCLQVINTAYNIDNEDLSFSFQPPVYTCDSLKFRVHMDWNGIPPFTLFYTQDNQSKTITTSQTSMDWYVENGMYTLDSVSDHRCTSSVIVNNQFNLSIQPFTAQLPQVSYDCNTLQRQFSCAVTGGVPPYTLRFLKNGVPDSVVDSSPNITWVIGNGDYQCIDVRDSLNCTQSISSFFQLDYQSLMYTIANPIYDCDSNKSVLSIHLQGNAPFSIAYTENGLQKYVNSMSTDLSLYLDNGYYEILSISDANCTEVLSNPLSYSINLDSLSVQVINQTYNCDSNSSTFLFTVTGNPPFTIFYTKDGVPQNLVSNSSSFQTLLANGVYNFINIVDGTGCWKGINQVFIIDYNPLSFQMNPAIYDCDLNKAKVHVDLFGNSPWTLFFTKDGVPSSVHSLNPSLDLMLDNGYYVFDSVSDATCTLSMGTINPYTINYQPLNLQVNNPQYSCDSDKTIVNFNFHGNAPFTVYYYRNFLIDSFTTNQTTYNLYLSNGQYFFYLVKDVTGCQQLLNNNYSFNYFPLDAQIVSQEYQCGATTKQVNVAHDGNAPFTLNYTDGISTYSASSVSSPSTLLLPNGTWTITNVSDATGCQFGINDTLLIESAIPLTANLVYDIYNCSLNKKEVQYLFTGYKPYTLYYHELGMGSTVYQSSFNTDTAILYLNQGVYFIDSVVDQNACSAQINQTILNDIDSLHYSVVSSDYDCDSAKLKLVLNLYGDAPWSVYYHEVGSGSVMLQQSNGPILPLYLSTGTFVVDSIQDNRCTKVYQDSYSNTISPLMAEINGPYLQCDSEQYYVILKTQGGVKPYRYNYNKNGTSLILSSYNEIDTFYLGKNHTFYFDEVLDSLDCSISLHQIVNKTPVIPTYLGYTTTYDCEKDSTLVSFDIDNSIGSILYFSKNQGVTDSLLLNGNNQFYFGNGDYEWTTIVWEDVCPLPVNQTVILQNNPVKWMVDSLVTQCIDKNYKYSISLDGLAPWQLTYIHNNELFQKLVVSKADSFTFLPGIYNFVAIVDAHQCIDSLSRVDTLLTFLPIEPTLMFKDQQLICSLPNYSLTWYKNDSVIDGWHGSSMDMMGKGDYYATLVDETGCLYQTNTIRIELAENEISIYPNPVTDRLYIFINQNVDEWQYEVWDVFGHSLEQGISNKSTFNISTAHYAKGIYMIKVYVGSKQYLVKFTKI